MADRFIPDEGASGTQRLRGSIGPRAGLDAVEQREVPCPTQRPNVSP
jgi:hypothetical protein